MPLFYFVLNNGQERVPDDGEELPDKEAARAHAILVARELMLNDHCHFASWRIEVRDDYLNPCLEVLFADADEAIEHLRPESCHTVKLAARSAASLCDSVSRVRTSIEQVQHTLASVDAAIAATTP